MVQETTSTRVSLRLGPLTALSPRPKGRNIFQLHHTLEDREGACKEAFAQLDMMDGQLKEAYDASEAVAKNIRDSLKKRNEELASSWKEAKQKTQTVETKLRTVGSLEEENRLLKAGEEKCATELAELKRHYAKWESKFEKVAAKKVELETFIEDFNVEHCEKLKAFSADAKEETTRIEKELDPKRGF
ncbi:hypothetical protein ZWY2020_048786 [Hordeum vulgare]|nr:hypothetical protein ZWY2020_048786 [Hordeum vulgare]